MIEADRPSVASAMRRVAAEGLLIAAMALAINLAGNGRVGLWDRDEPRYAVAVREMRERGDWLAPTFNGEPRYHKPIFIYWVMGLGTGLFGDNPYGARIGSAVAGALTCALTWGLGRRMLGPTAGRVAALALATSPIVVVESKMATTDATLSCCFVFAQACLWALNRGPSRRAAAGFWVAMAVATLTKGPVGPALIAASGLACWKLGGPTSCWGRLHWRWGPALFAALTLPWYVAIGVASGGDFYRFAVGVQLVRRATTGVEQHGGFPGFYPVTAMATFYPWSALIPSAMLAAWRGRKGSPELGFLLGWVVGPVLVLEAFRTKLVHYDLPVIPGLALLAGWLVEAIGRDGTVLRRRPGGRLAMAWLVGVGVAGSAGFVAAAFVEPEGLRWPLLVMAAVLAFGTIAARVRFDRAEPVAATRAMAACWAALALIVWGWLLPRAEPYRLSRVVGERLAGLADAERAVPILVTYQEPGIHYAMRRRARTIWDWDEIHRILAESPTLVTALKPDEERSLREDGRFRVDVLESLDGFDLSKGEPRPLRLARLRPSVSPTAGAVSSSTRPSCP